MTETRNIVDHYWYEKTEAIKASLDKKRHNFSILCSNLAIDFNIATVIRNSNAFLAKQIYIYGSRRYDRRGTVGTHHYENIEFIKDIEEVYAKLFNFTWVGIDNIDGARNIRDYIWPENSLLVFGQEQIGIPQELLVKCKDIIYIKQHGSVRSLNVGCASAIAMADWCNKNV